MHSVKLAISLCIGVSFTLSSLHADIVSVVYDSYQMGMNLDLSLGDVSKMSLEEVTQLMAKQKNDPSNLQKKGNFKMVFTGKEYGYCADTTVKKGKFAIDGPQAIYYDLVQNQSLRPSIKQGGSEYELEVVVCPYKKNEWIIEDETQTIKGLLCKKARRKMNAEKKSKNTAEIIAWFCESLPYTVGPKGYTGLPGLIVRLDTEIEAFGGLTQRDELKSYSLLKDNSITLVQPKGKRVECKGIHYQVKSVAE